MADSQKLAAYFDDYSSHHRTRGNKLSHYIGVPMLTLTVLGLLAHWQFSGADGSAPGVFRWDAGIILWAIASLWYVILEAKIGISFALCSLGFYFIGRALPMPVLWTLFILGWIIQYIGHLVYEKKSPAFYTNLKHLLVGPLWIFCAAIGYKPQPK